MRMHKKRSKFWNKQSMMVYFIAFIMIFSIGGFLISFRSPASAERYGDYAFTRQGNLWITRIDKIPVPFHYLPGQLVFYNIDEKILNGLKNTKAVIVTFDPNTTSLQSIELVRFELKEDFPKFFDIFVAEGISREDERYNLPIITCENATQFVPVILFVENNVTSIRVKDNCIIISGIHDEFLKMKDRIMYGMLGIIE